MYFCGSEAARRARGESGVWTRAVVGGSKTAGQAGLGLTRLFHDISYGFEFDSF